MTLIASIGHFAVALDLFVFGVFCLLGAVAMTMRRGLARDIHAPIPNDPSAQLEVRVGRAILRGEHNRIPLYTFMIKAFLRFGFILMVGALIALLVAWI